MASVVEFENLQYPTIKKFRIRISKPTEQLAQELINKLAKEPIWASDSLNIAKEDRALFMLYQLESEGMVTSKIEQKTEKRYERRFYITDLGKKLVNH